jgi:hypothetical protein
MELQHSKRARESLEHENSDAIGGIETLLVS